MLERTLEALPDFPKVQAKSLKIWEGLRPVTPDGLPLIGRTSQVKNLLVATGHAMMGVSNAPVTGNLISSIVEDNTGSFYSDFLSPNRF